MELEMLPMCTVVYVYSMVYISSMCKSTRTGLWAYTVRDPVINLNSLRPHQLGGYIYIYFLGGEYGAHKFW